MSFFPLDEKKKYSRYLYLNNMKFLYGGSPMLHSGRRMARYHQDYEPFLYMRKNTGSKWRGGTTERKVWYMKRNASNDFHPTEKPIDIIQRMILNSSDENDLILDPFLGSGTTAVACKKLNSSFYRNRNIPRLL